MTRLRTARKLPFILVAFVLIGAFLLVGFSNLLPKTQAAWFDDNFTYRTVYTFTGGTAVTYQKVKFDINTQTLITNGKMQSDCGDARFVNAAGKVLQYYLDAAGGACNGTSTDFYVLLPNIVVGGNIVYNYYGNPGAVNGTQFGQFSQSTYTPDAGPTAGSEEKGVGPVGYWKMDEGYGTTVTRDSTTNGNNASIAGGGNGGPTKIDDASNFGEMVTQGRQVVRSSTGTLYTFFSKGTTGVCEVWKSTDGSSWSEVDSANSPACSTSKGSVALAIDSSNNLHITYVLDDAPGFILSYRKMTSEVFGSEETVDSSLVPVGLDIAVDSNDVPHIVWSDDIGGNGSLEYGNRVGGLPWSNVVIEGATYLMYGASITVDEDNLPEFAYLQSGIQNDLVVGVGNANDATSFTNHEPDASIDMTINTRGTSVGVDSAGNSVVAYIDSDGSVDIFKRTDGNELTSWSTGWTENDTGVSGKEPSLALNSTDIYVFYQNSGNDVSYNKYSGSWLGDTVLQTGTFSDIKTKWSYYNNNQGSTRIDYLYSDATDIYWASLSFGEITPSWQLDSQCVASRCLDFDGSDDVATVTNANAIDLDGGLAAAFTFSTWIRPNTDGEGDLGQVFQKGTNTYLRTSGQSGSNLNIAASLDLATTDATVTITAPITIDTWSHVAMVYADDGDDEIDIYVNGKLVGSSVNGSGAPAADTNNLLIGGVSTANFDGRIDDFKIYNTAKTGAEIQAIYDGPGVDVGAGGKLGAVSASGNAPVGYWNFEEGSGTTVNDVSASSSAKTGTWSGTGGRWTDGQYGKAGSFNGRDDFVSMANSIPNAQTVAFWVNPTSTTTYLVGFDATHYITASSGTISATGFASPTIYVNGVPGGTLVANVWQHVAVTTGTGAAGGAITFGKANSLFLNGKMDEVRIYDYARTPAQIVQDMNASHPLGGSPVSSMQDFWRFSEGQGYYSTSSGIQKTTASIAPSVAVPPSIGISGWQPNGMVGKAVAYNSSSSNYADLGDLTYTEAVSSLSVSLWVNPNALVSGRCILCKYDGSALQRTWAVRVDSDAPNTGVRVNIATQANDDGSKFGKTPAGVLEIGKWAHVAFVYDGTQTGNANRLKIYINGVKQNTSYSGTIPALTVASTSQGRIAGTADGVGGFFSGQVDEVKIYSGALSDSEIKLDYNQGSGIALGVLGTSTFDGKTASNSAGAAYCVSGSTESCDPPVGEWLFEQPSATGEAVDTSGNGSTLTNNNSSKYLGGFQGKAVSFARSSSQSMSVSDNATLSMGSTSFTIQTWVNLATTTGDSPLVTKADTAAGPASVYEYNLRWQSGATFDFFIRQASDNALKSVSSTGVAIPAANTWHFVVVWYDSAAQTLNMQIDGGAINTTTGVSALADGTSTFRLGTVLSTPSDYANAKLDNVRIYKYVRSVAQRSYDFNRGAPVAHWKVDACQGTSLADSVGTNSATLTVGASGSQTAAGTCAVDASTVWFNGRIGKFNYSINLDGNDDYAQVLNPSFLGDQQGSVSMWVNLTSGGNIFGVTDKDTTFQNVFILTMTLGTPCDMEMNIYRGGVANSVMHGSATGMNCPASNWAHFVLTSSGSSYQFYLNGQRVKTYATSGSNDGKWFGFISNGDNVSIGGDIESNALNSPATGKYDDVRIFNYKLTDYQVRTLYNQNATVRFGPITGAP